jgi:hypothetical protein
LALADCLTGFDSGEIARRIERGDVVARIATMVERITVDTARYRDRPGVQPSRGIDEP